MAVVDRFDCTLKKFIYLISLNFILFQDDIASCSIDEEYKIFSNNKVKISVLMECFSTVLLVELGDIY